MGPALEGGKAKVRNRPIKGTPKDSTLKSVGTGNDLGHEKMGTRKERPRKRKGKQKKDELSDQ